MGLKIKDQLLAVETVESVIDELFQAHATPTKANLVEIIASHRQIFADDTQYWAKRILKFATEEGWIRYDAEAGFYVRTHLPGPSTDEPVEPASELDREPQARTDNSCSNQRDTQIIGLSRIARCICLLISAAAILAVVSKGADSRLSAGNAEAKRPPWMPKSPVCAAFLRRSGPNGKANAPMADVAPMRGIYRQQQSAQTPGSRRLSGTETRSPTRPGTARTGRPGSPRA